MTFALRGDTGDRDENTVAAFRRALGVGVSGIGSQVRLAADGEPVLCARATVRSGLRRLPVDATPVETLVACGVARLADAYDDLGTGFDLALDVGDIRAAAPVAAVALSFDAAERLWVRASDLELLSAVKAGDPAIRLVHVMGRRAYGDGLERHTADLARLGIGALALHDAEWSKGLVALVHRFGLLAFADDVRDTRRAGLLVGMGVDALSSPQPSMIVAATTGPGR